jgi:N-acetylglucosaminyl-diphospho-decaprenol L-rhamnosyltransferase
VLAEVAVQIVNYNTKPYLERCLAAVQRDLDESGIAAAILVIDNDSDDDLSDLQAAYPRVGFQQSERNVGFGAAQNVLARAHDARAILLLNPDTELVEPRTVARLLAVLDGDPGVAAVGPRLVGADGAGQRWDHGELDGAWARLARAAGHSHYRPRAARADVAWISGACALVDRSHFDAAGGFDPQFFLYKEEEDLFLRIRRAGGRVVYEPAVAAVHHGSVSAGRGHHLETSVARYRAKHVPSRVQRAVMPVVHRQAVVWDGRVRRLLRQRTR